MPFPQLPSATGEVSFHRNLAQDVILMLNCPLVVFGIALSLGMFGVGWGFLPLLLAKPWLPSKVHALIMFFEIEFYRIFFLNLSFSSSSVTLNWSSPATGVMKLNCDASKMHAIDVIGFGCVVRDNNGDWHHRCASSILAFSVFGAFNFECRSRNGAAAPCLGRPRALNVSFVVKQRVARLRHLGRAAARSKQTFIWTIIYRCETLDVRFPMAFEASHLDLCSSSYDHISDKRSRLTALGEFLRIDLRMRIRHRIA
ncbi:hypothetical protein PIB30_016211 [Stylosanthes scabra]|uniref:Uncharacterized protein n=1 Tax=Stylosanthes scabra TaxID=79078 RepID=A0ABU6WAR1_9FABA|nr:hypothetical protein [Stylosanthes scabra]